MRTMTTDCKATPRVGRKCGDRPNLLPVKVPHDLCHTQLTGFGSTTWKQTRGSPFVTYTD